MVKADVVFDVRSPVTSLGVLRRGLDDPEAVLVSVEAGFLHELPSTVLGSPQDDLRRVLDDPGAVFASVEAGSLHELPSTVLGSLLIAFELMGIRGELFGSE